jgi:hypothetical protein
LFLQRVLLRLIYMNILANEKKLASSLVLRWIDPHC